MKLLALSRRALNAARSSTLAVMALALSGPALAAGYPSEPVHLVVPYPAGAGVDIAIRMLSPALEKQLGQPLVIENKAGAGAIIGVDYVAKARGDGYTIGIADAGPLTMNPSLYPRLPYAPASDFALVSLVATLPTFLLVSPNLQVNTLPELIAAAKVKRRMQISYASGGLGTYSHLAMEALKRQAGIHMLHVPYRGTAPALAAVLSGEPQVMFGNMLTTGAYVKAGRLRALATAGATRSAVAPAIPTIAEAGLPGYDMLSWFGIIAPVATPPAIVARLRAAFSAALNDPEIRRRLLEEGGMEVPSGAEATPEAFKARLKRDTEVYRKLIVDGHISLE